MADVFMLCFASYLIMASLVIPSATYKTSFIDAICELQANGIALGDGILKLNPQELEQHFNEYLRTIRRFEPGNDLPKGYVHSESRWLVIGTHYVGRASLRYELNKRLREFGGHIGYEIRPSERNKGYGKLILKLMLARAAELGIEQALVSCDDNNPASAGIIEANGGILEGVFTVPNHNKPIRRYWINTPQISKRN